MTKKEMRQFVIRLRVLFAFVVCIGFVLIANLFYIQVRSGDEFRTQADGQYVVSTYNSFERGSIFFEQKDGTRMSAAGQRSGYKVSINPSTFSADPDLVFDTINAIHEIDKESFFAALEKKKRTYIEIANRLSKEDGEAVKKELGKAIQLHAEKWRVYPLQGAGAHVLGFLGFKGDDYAGRYGLERSYEETLRRTDTDVYRNFFARIFHDVRGIVDPNVDFEGDIVTTIDPQVQVFFESQIKGIQEKWSSKSSGGIIMNPQTGEVYGLGAVPNFDNNSYGDFSINTFKNPLVENVHEMGSIMKPLIVAMAVDSGSINADTMEYYDHGFIKVGDRTIKNFDSKGRGWVKVQDILNQSLNTGMAHIASKIPKNDFRDYFDKYGFMSKTGIDLPNEGNNLTSNLKSKRNVEFANMSFGQGIALTPISMARALSALGNKGKLAEPHLVKRIEYTNGLAKNISSEEETGLQALSPETAGKVSQMLVNVFDNYADGGYKIS